MRQVSLSEWRDIDVSELNVAEKAQLVPEYR